MLLLLDGDNGVPGSAFSVAAVFSILTNTDLFQTKVVKYRQPASKKTNVVRHCQLALNKITSEV